MNVKEAEGKEFFVAAASLAVWRLSQKDFKVFLYTDFVLLLQNSQLFEYTVKFFLIIVKSAEWLEPALVWVWEISISQCLMGKIMTTGQ